MNGYSYMKNVELTDSIHISGRITTGRISHRLMLQCIEKYIKNTEKKIQEFLSEYGKYILGGLLVSTLAYFMMMSLNLVNNLDGVWHPSNFIAGNWEISLGRGLQRYADRARFGIVSDSFNTILTLLLISTANATILKTLSFDIGLHKELLLILLSVNPVICESLSYSYMSVNFGLAYLFSVISFVCLSETRCRKQILTRGSAGGLFLGISMAFYQAYICVTSLLILITLLKLLCRESEQDKVYQLILSGLHTIICGGVVYYAITQTLLLRAGISLSSYKGAAKISPLLIITQLPQSIKRCYAEFFNYFGERKAFSNLEFIDVILLGMFAFYLSAFIIQFIRLIKHNRLYAILLTATILLLPVACCFILLIAVGNTMTGLMSMGLVMCPVLLVAIVPQTGRSGFYMKRLNILLLVAFAWFQLAATVNDQLALKEGKTATITLTENIICQLTEEGYLNTNQPVAFIGRPANNDGFAQSTAYQMANEYAKFGCWSTDARNNRMSWAGVISNFLGINLNLCGDSEYQELTCLDLVAEMPVFPSEGSIRVIRDVIVIKVSDLY